MPICPSCGKQNLDENKFCANCGAGLTGLTGQLASNTILEGRYVIVETLGQGGMGAVYKALDTRLSNVTVAVKEMSTRAVGTGKLQGSIEAFKKEADILVKLRHPALPRINDFFSVDEDRWYLVMDYIEGETLKTIVERRGPIPEAEVLDWTRQLCGILDYLHNQQPPVIFRDLKPANIMLTPQGTIKLIDFGIARHFSPGSTSDTTAYGSPGYSPPEQHGKHQTDARSDIYALGATLHHLLTGIDPGKKPFIFEPPGQSVPVSQELQSATMKALELRAENRPASIREMLALLPMGSERDSGRTGTLPLEIPILQQTGYKGDIPAEEITQELIIPDQSESVNDTFEEPNSIQGITGHSYSEYGLEVQKAKSPGWLKSLVAVAGVAVLLVAGGYGYTHMNDNSTKTDLAKEQTETQTQIQPQPVSELKSQMGQQVQQKQQIAQETKSEQQPQILQELQGGKNTQQQTIQETLSTDNSKMPPVQPRNIIPCVYTGDIEGVKEALAAGANPNVMGTWPLVHHAAASGNYQILELLIQAGADVNKVYDGWQVTPLMFAAGRKGTFDINQEKRYPECVKLLLASGANLNKRDPNSETALTYAKSCSDNDEIVRMLTMAGAVE